MLLLGLLGRDAEDRVLDLHLFRWIPTGALDVDAGLRLDPLSLTFVLLVTFVGTLIHVYSVAYMEHDVDRRRFFAYLNLFVAAMLVLVLADSYLLLFVGWEGVGLASYLLIGFWNHRTPYAVAAKKAFVANRVGDLGLLIALMIMVATFGAVDFETVLGAAAGRRRGDAHRDRPDAAARAPAASRRSSRCSPGSATRWPARPRSPRSSTPRRWSPRACTSSCGPRRSSRARRPRSSSS